MIFRLIKCLLYDFPYPILPNEMVKKKTPENAFACISGQRFCCKFEQIFSALMVNHLLLLQAYKVDCTSMKQEVANLRCFDKVLANEVFQTSRIVLQFPKDDIQAPPVGNFGGCESKSAFQDMRYIDKQFEVLLT